MNRSFFPIGSAARGVENAPNTARPFTCGITAEWVPALTYGSTGGNAGNANVITNGSGILAGIVVGFQPPNFVASPVSSTVRANAQALFFDLGASEGALIFSPTRNGTSVSDAQAQTGYRRGNAAICIQMSREANDEVASATRAIAIGNSNKASGTDAVAIGYRAQSTSTSSIALGNVANCTGSSGIAIGSSASAADAIAIGGSASASGSSGLALGGSATASGSASVAVGQSCNTNSLLRAVSLGWTNTSVYQCTLSFSAHNFAAAGDAAFHLSQQVAETTTATSQELLFRATAAQRIGVAASTAMQFRCTVVARQRAGAAGTVDDSAGWSFEGVVKRSAAGTPVIVGQATTHTAADAGAATWTAVVSADAANNALVVTVTGEADKTIRWLAYWQLTRVG